MTMAVVRRVKLYDARLQVSHSGPRISSGNILQHGQVKRPLQWLNICGSVLQIRRQILQQCALRLLQRRDVEE